MFSALTDWGSFLSSKYKFYLYAPPKCASTSILTALVDLVDPEAQIPSDLTSQNLSSLDIHPYVRDHYAPTQGAVIDAFASSEFCKLLIVRDPLSRFLSAITSKYLIGDGPYANELTLGSAIKNNLKKDYSNIQNLRDDVNFVSTRLLTALSLGISVSHVRPLSDIFSERDLLLFDHVINVSNRGFSVAFQASINQHLQHFGASIDALPRCNESPLSIPAEFLETEVLNHILEFYRDDYVLLGMEPPKVSDFFTSDFDHLAFAKENSYKISSAELFYDVSSKYFQSDRLCKDLITERDDAMHWSKNLKVDKENMRLEKENALNWANNLKVDKENLQLEKENALNWAKNLKVKKEKLQLELETLANYKKNSILHIAQLQEDLELMSNLIRKKDKKIKVLENTLAERLKRSFKSFMRNILGKLQPRRSKK